MHSCLFRCVVLDCKGRLLADFHRSGRYQNRLTRDRDFRVVSLAIFVDPQVNLVVIVDHLPSVGPQSLTGSRLGACFLSILKPTEGLSRTLRIQIYFIHVRQPSGGCPFGILRT